MNKHLTTTVIAGGDNSIDTNSNTSTLKAEPQSSGAEIRELRTDAKTLNTWNWRIETDTAELFIGMFG